MTQTTASTTGSGIWTPPPGAHRLQRPQSGRVLGGVCSGLARYLRLDPVVFRVVLAVLAVTGSGVLLYAIGYLALPADGDEVSPLEALLGRGRSSASAGLSVTVGVLGLLSLLWLAVVRGVGLVLGAAAVVGLVLLMRRDGHPLPWQQRTPQRVEPYAPHGPYPPGPGVGPAPAGPTTPAGPTATAGPTAPAADQPYGAGPASDQPYGAGQASSDVPPPGPPGYPSYGPWQPGPVVGQRQPSSATGNRQVTLQVGNRSPSPLGFLTFALAAVSVLAVLAAGWFGWLTATPTELLAVPLAVTTVGVLLSAVAGRARGMIGVGLLLVVGLVAVQLLHITSVHQISATVGDRDYRPATQSEVQRVYNLGVGDTTIDLSHVDFTGSTAISIHTGVGDADIILPPEVTLQAHARVGIGDIDILGRQLSGSGTQDVTSRGTGDGTVQLLIRGGIGDVEVTRA